MRETPGQGTGNSWLLLPMPAPESRPDPRIHCTPRLRSPQGPPAGWSQTVDLKKRPQYKSPSPGGLVLDLPTAYHRAKGQAFYSQSAH